MNYKYYPHPDNLTYDKLIIWRAQISIKEASRVRVLISLAVPVLIGVVGPVWARFDPVRARTVWKTLKRPLWIPQ